MGRALVTAALPYVNAVPHVGNVVGSHLPADIFARYHRAKGDEVLFVGGSDVHGTPNVLSALELGMPVDDFCARLHAIHKRIYDWFGISYDIFSRTSRPLHHETTREFFRKVHENGYISAGDLDQLYCPRDRRYLPDRYVQGICPHCGYGEAYGDQCEQCGHFLDPKILKEPRCRLCRTTPELRRSKHLFLKLDRLAPKLEAWIERSEHWRPQVRNVALGWIREGLRERCITRDLEWGVRVPIEGFEDKVFYVWFDAPIGYLSFTKEARPADGEAAFWLRDAGTDARIYHWLGKDNIPFHTIFFPGMLMAHGGYNLPYRVDGLQFLNYEGQKISKSKRWGVFCERLPEVPDLDPDVLRAYLTFLIPEVGDTEWRWDDFERRINSDIIGTFANFVHRTLSIVKTRLEGKVRRPVPPWEPIDEGRVEALASRARTVNQRLEAGELRAAFGEILALAADGNQYFDHTAPWKLVKENRQRATLVLSLCVEYARALAVLVAPFLPGAASRIWRQLRLPGREADPAEWARAGELTLPESHTIGDPAPLFRKLVPEEVKRIAEVVTQPGDLKALVGAASPSA